MVLCWIAKFRIKLKYVLAALCLITVAFIVRQITWLDDLTEDYVRGVHVKQARFYVPNENGKFQCLVNGKFIDFVKVNDDYCDCEDGTDEPGTDACPNGKFYCKIDEYKRKGLYSYYLCFDLPNYSITSSAY